MADRRVVDRDLVGSSDEKSPLDKPRRRWEDTIIMYLQEVGWEARTQLLWFRAGTGGEGL
jgi:hypothetical protein